MCKISSNQVLKLYKDLLRYGQQLTLTDKDYFCRRIIKEFKKNKSLTDPKDIQYNFQKGVTLLLRRAVQ
ncbi:MIEF1 upstream open reading frame protein [Anoplophora glabripennis]|uniref:MIEF1 upstream open reading frame protein n=1 Tax=Anoplophora glabripennis TaxID=217634 RepID=UPI000874F236|nr:MIEF1 upstream open reading frame protein [Anoplophora glabripennis]